MVNSRLLNLIKNKDLDTEHLKRLKWELKEISVHPEHCYDEYLLKIYDKGCKHLKNENNLLICKLLGICDDFDINKPPMFDEGEYPDIDIDYLPVIQEYLKNDYVPKAFGSEYVCNIANYGTLGVKQCLLDVSKVFGYDRKDILALTKHIPMKDEDGEAITFETAQEGNPDLKKFLEDNPEIYNAVSRLVGKNKSRGQHAAGVVISSVPISDYMPLILGKKDMPCSAWNEGQRSQDLSWVGFIKQDFLSCDALTKIKNTLDLIRERHGIEKICALPGQDNWSDLSYLNDPIALEMANKGDLKLIFQFDKPTVRLMAKQGGVTRFEDSVAYTALNRPGPLEAKMHTTYIKRKNKAELYEIHPLLEPILGNTYGVIIYQEQVQRILEVVGKIPKDNTLEILKAISKKKIDKFAKYKEMFVTNGQKVLEYTQKQVEDLWNLLEKFSGYGFNLCVLGEHTVKDMATGKKYTISELADKDIEKESIKLLSYKNGELIEDGLVDVFSTGEKEVFEVSLDNGMIIKCTLNHKFLCSDNQIHTLQEIIDNDLEILYDCY